jgi:hypothetical protein
VPVTRSAPTRFFKPASPPLISLLRAAAAGRRDLALARFGDCQIRWAVDTGLGPLLYHCVAEDPEARNAPLWPLIQGAHAMARLITHELLDAMSEIIDVCGGRVATLTLLKGISICQEHYPAPHLRSMRDIDLLVDVAEMSAVEALLRERGYRPRSNMPAEFYDQHHHGMPLFHERRGVWVEIHRGLFPPGSEPGADSVFSHEHVKSQLRASVFRDQPVTRLSNELQIVYTAAHWAFDLAQRGGMIAMLDLIYLLGRGRQYVDWRTILRWLDGSMAASSLYLLLAYLDRRNLVRIDPDVMRQLSVKQRSLGRMNLSLAHALLDHHVAAGRSLGGALDKRNFDILWKTLLLPGPPARNLMLIPWNLLPWWLRPGRTRVGPTARAQLNHLPILLP